MSATKTQKQKVLQGTVFPDQNSFEVFLEDVERSARGVDVKRENIPLILELLREKFGQNLPEEEEL